MSLTQFTIAKLQPLLTKLCGCHYSTTKSQIKKSVFISQSNDIFANLALEDWLYCNYDFSNHHIMMLSYNDPCVVIGKHQNPWLETNISNLPNITEKGVKLARRCSSGGTVYYDKGNLNITFFTTKDKWNFKHNMQLIARAIFRRYGININTTPTQDLAVRNSKVSF